MQGGAEESAIALALVPMHVVVAHRQIQRHHPRQLLAPRLLQQIQPRTLPLHHPRHHRHPTQHQQREIMHCKHLEDVHNMSKQLKSVAPQEFFSICVTRQLHQIDRAVFGGIRHTVTLNLVV